MSTKYSFGEAKPKREGDIADPDDYDWEHDPIRGGCAECTARYNKWLASYREQELNRGN